MKAIQMKDILNYRFLSDVKYAPDGNTAAFVVSYGKEDDNKYEGHIWIWDKEKVRQLTGLGKERSYVWEDCEHLLFAAVRSDAEKKRAKRKIYLLLFTGFLFMAEKQHWPLRYRIRQEESSHWETENIG